MRTESLQFLERLVNTPSPSGHEARGQRVWLDYVKPVADETFSDAYGNTVAVLNKGGSPRLMLAAHADFDGGQLHQQAGLYLCAQNGGD
jgi:endoglucanase